MEQTRIIFKDNEQRTATVKLLKFLGFSRVENAYWVEHWQKENTLVILEREG